MCIWETPALSQVCSTMELSSRTLPVSWLGHCVAKRTLPQVMCISQGLSKSLGIGFWLLGLDFLLFPRCVFVPSDKTEENLFSSRETSLSCHHSRHRSRACIRDPASQHTWEKWGIWGFQAKLAVKVQNDTEISEDAVFVLGWRRTPRVECMPVFCAGQDIFPAGFRLYH